MAALAAAGIGAAGSVLGGITGGKGAAAAAKAQAAAQQAAINEQHQEFSTIQANEQPYMAAGQQGLTGQLGLLGLNGAGTQQSAIDALKASPAFTSLYNTGNDTILQDKAATGGLRGGDTNNSLAMFGSGLLNQVIQQQLAGYQGLTGVGQAAAAGTNAGATSTGTAISNLLNQQGTSNALGALSPYAALQGVVSQLIGKGGGLSGLLSAQSNKYTPPTSDEIGVINNVGSGLTGGIGLGF